MKTLSSLIVLLTVLLAGILSTNFVLATEKIDINSAPLEDLIKIIHIGEARAQELISLRPFSSLDDLTKINGIGSSRIADIKKQGLAWVDESYKTETQITEAQPPTDKELAAISEQVPLKLSFLLLIAIALAIFSGIIILILKKKLKVV